MTNRLKNKAIYMTYAIFWFFVNLLTLNTYPLMHSDESWLAALTVTMMDEKNLMATEPFFDLAPRAPHTLKTLYHLLQMPLIKLLGYNLSSVRFLSLLFATGSLIVLILIFHQLYNARWKVLLSVAIITLNSQFIYGAHLARQEMALVFVLLLSYKLYLSDHLNDRSKALIISALIGISISFHPNAFMIAMMIGTLYLYDFLRHKVEWTSLLLYALPMATFALLNLLITFLATSNFLQTYWLYASTLSVGAPPQSRVENFIDFYIKLDQQISGTYFLPSLSYLFIACLIGVILLIMMIYLIKVDRKKALPIGHCLLMSIGFNLALFLIGRYNPTSIIFQTVIITMFLSMVIGMMPSPNYQWPLYGLLLLATLNVTYMDTRVFSNHDYEAYHTFIEEQVSGDDVILANLSGGFALSPNQFYDIRNLNYLGEQTLSDYLKERQINTIIYYEEYDYIHRNPSWLILYGDDSAYYEALQTIIEDYGTLRAETTSPYYGNRIIRYLGDYSWQIKIIDIDVQAID